MEVPFLRRDQLCPLIPRHVVESTRQRVLRPPVERELSQHKVRFLEQPIHSFVNSCPRTATCPNLPMNRSTESFYTAGPRDVPIEDDHTIVMLGLRLFCAQVSATLQLFRHALGLLSRPRALRPDHMRAVRAQVGAEGHHDGAVRTPPDSPAPTIIPLDQEMRRSFLSLVPSSARPPRCIRGTGFTHRNDQPRDLVGVFVP